MPGKGSPKKVGSTWWFRCCTVGVTVGITKDGKFACLKAHPWLALSIIVR